MKVNLEQWAAFVAVVEEGSFAKAAERLNKSQSSVSYTLEQLRQRLPAPVLHLQGRKAEVTELGKVLYRQALTLLKRAEDIEDSAAYLARGWEAEVSVAVDALYHLEPLYCALQSFSDRSPHTRVRILETTLSGTEEALLTRKAHIVLVGRIPVGFVGFHLGDAHMLPVVSPTHPLAQTESISEDALSQWRQIVVRDTGTRREQDAGWLSADQRWTVSQMSTSIEIVTEGLGFAFLPQAKIRRLLREGKLVTLNIENFNRRTIPLHLILSTTSPGPGTTALSEEIKKAYVSSFKTGAASRT